MLSPRPIMTAFDGGKGELAADSKERDTLHWELEIVVPYRDS